MNAVDFAYTLANVPADAIITVTTDNPLITVTTVDEDNFVVDLSSLTTDDTITFTVKINGTPIAETKTYTVA